MQPKYDFLSVKTFSAGDQSNGSTETLNNDLLNKTPFPP